MGTSHDGTMTTDHLDDEAISAHLDGEATPAEAAHVDGCETCTARLAELRAASEAIGSPVDLGFADRDATVAAAMAAAATSNVVPLASRRRTGPPQWLAVAAALLVVVALVPLLGSLGGGDSDDSAETAASGEAADDTMAFDADAADGTELAMGPVDGGNVGEVDVAGIRELVEEAVAGPPAAQRSDEAQEESEGAGGGDAAMSAPATDAVPAPCEDAARTDFPEMGALRYRALGTYEGEEVSVLAFELPTEVQRIRVLVRAVDDCAIRNVQELEPS